MRKLLFILLLIPSLMMAQGNLAFPSAYGGGSNTTGGRGGIVIHVTNLNDSGSGSLREALLTEQTRTIVFDVSGRIDLLSRIDIPLAASNFTVAGQTAPQGGITITGRPIKLGGGDSQGCNNAIFRYIRFRNGRLVGSEDYDSNGLIAEGTDGLVVDHCSFSFCNDQAISASAWYGDLINHTIQRCIFSENTTGAISGVTLDNTTGNITYIYNLWVHDHHRSPNFNGNGRFDIINQVQYNWLPRSMRISVGTPSANVIGNYYRPGTYTFTNSLHEITGSPTPSIYTANNYHPILYPTPQLNDHGIFTVGNIPSYFTSTQHTLLPNTPTPLSAQEAYNEVVNTSVATSDVGANRYLNGDGSVGEYRDTYDTERINDIINSVSRDPANQTWVQPTLPTNTRGVGFDTDSDGIPDAYETIRGWSTTVANNNTVTHANGYTTQLEEYLNLVDSEDIAVTGITWDNDTQTIGTGETVDLSVTFTPTNASNKGVTYSSDSTDDLSNAGVWVSEGSANFTVTTDDGGFTDIMAVTTSAATIPVTAISIAPATADVATGSTQQLTETYTPTNATDKTGVWTSSNSQLATVNSSGLVTAISSSSDLVINGGFDTDTDWIKQDPAWTISGGTASCDGTQPFGVSVYQDANIVNNKSYFVTFTVSNYSAGNVRVYVGGGDSGADISANGTYTQYISISNYFDSNIWIQGDVNFIGDIDNVSCYEFPQITYTTNDGGFTDTSDITVTTDIGFNMKGFIYGGNDSPYIYYGTIKKRIKN